MSVCVYVAVAASHGFGWNYLSKLGSMLGWVSRARPICDVVESHAKADVRDKRGEKGALSNLKIKTFDLLWVLSQISVVSNISYRSRSRSSLKPEFHYVAYRPE